MGFNNAIWSKYKISDLCDVIGGGTPSTTEPSFWDGELQWFTPTEVGKTKYVQNSVRTITQKGYKASSAKTLPVGTVLLTTRATIGDVSIALKECCTNQGFQSLVPKNDTNGEFLYYLIQTKRKELRTKANGSTFVEISNQVVKSINVRVPDSKTQTKIAKFLSVIDARIETQNKIIESMDSQINYISELLINREKIHRTNLSHICKITTGKLDANEMVTEGKYRFYTCASTYFRIDRYAFDCEALLISGNGANVGYIHYYNGKFNAYQRTYVLYDFHDVDAKYLKIYLDLNLKRRIESEKNIGNTPYIRLSTLSDMQINIPSLERQKKISNCINLLQEKMEIEKNILKLLRDQKTYLLNNLFI